MWRFDLTRRRFDLKPCDLIRILFEFCHDLICDLNKSQVSASYHKLLLKSYSNIFFLFQQMIDYVQVLQKL